MSEREEAAKKIVKKYSLVSAGAGLIPLALVDLAAITGVQVKMIADLAKNYDIPFKKDVGKSALAGLVGGGVGTSLGTGTIPSLVKAVPVVGPIASWTVMPAFGGASTYAVGKVFTQHFESGGTFLNFNPDEVREHYEKELAAAAESESATN